MEQPDEEEEDNSPKQVIDKAGANFVSLQPSSNNDIEVKKSESNVGGSDDESRGEVPHLNLPRNFNSKERRKRYTRYMSDVNMDDRLDRARTFNQNRRAGLSPINEGNPSQIDLD